MKVPKVPPPCTITLPTPWISSLPEKNLVKKSCTCSAYVAIDVSFMLGQGVRRSRRLRRAFYSIDTFSYFHVSTSHSHSKRSKATKDAARGHANTHAHHEAHLHPVKAGWLPSSMHGSLWHRHAGLEINFYLNFQNLSSVTLPLGDFVCTSIDLTLLSEVRKNEKNLSDCQRRLQIFQVVRKTSWQYHLLFLEHSLSPGLPLFCQSSWPKMRCGGQTFT